MLVVCGLFAPTIDGRWEKSGQPFSTFVLLFGTNGTVYHWQHRFVGDGDRPWDTVDVEYPSLNWRIEDGKIVLYNDIMEERIPFCISSSGLLTFLEPSYFFGDMTGYEFIRSS